MSGSASYSVRLAPNATSSERTRDGGGRQRDDETVYLRESRLDISVERENRNRQKTRDAGHHIERLHPAQVILMARWDVYDATWRKGSSISERLPETVRRLHSAGVPEVVVLGPPPR